MKNNWLVISVIVVLTLATLYFWDSPPKMLLPGPLFDESKRFPYAIINDAHSQHFDDNGQLSYEFVAITLKHFRRDFGVFRKDDYTELEAPALTLFTEDQPWYITAEMGKLTEKGELLVLTDKVRIWQQNQPEGVTELTTNTLEIQLTKKQVKTADDVQIRLPQGQFEARGMIIDLATKNIQLLERVRGIHEPI
jgi:lipopolysaccharide export system protein LptC